VSNAGIMLEEGALVSEVSSFHLRSADLMTFCAWLHLRSRPSEQHLSLMTQSRSR
jgi:hypothetical protein